MQRRDSKLNAQKTPRSLASHRALGLHRTSLLIGEILELEPARPRHHRVQRASQLLAEAGELLRVLIRESREVQGPHAVRRRA